MHLRFKSNILAINVLNIKYKNYSRSYFYLHVCKYCMLLYGWNDFFPGQLSDIAFLWLLETVFIFYWIADKKWIDLKKYSTLARLLECSL